MSQAVSRALVVLRFISERPRSLTEVAQILEVHKSTALRLLQTLVAQDFARQDDKGRYSLSFGLLGLIQASFEQMELRSVARPHMQALAEQYGHTVHLAQLDGDRILYTDKVEGRGTVAMGSRIGHAVELHTAGVSKAILAFLDSATRRRFERLVTYQRYTDTTITTTERFAEELEVTRRRGWAEDDGEKEDYINCVAFPLFDATGSVVGSFSVTALKAVAPLGQLRELVPSLLTLAADVSRELGWRTDAKTS